MTTIKIIVLVLLGMFVIDAQPRKSPRIINLEEYTALRAELSREVDQLKERVKKLELACSGPIAVYEIDTMAGKLRCRSCAQVDEYTVTLTKETP